MLAVAIGYSSMLFSCHAKYAFSLTNLPHTNFPALPHHQSMEQEASSCDIMSE